MHGCRSPRSVAFAHDRGIPVTARGAGHGYVGGSVPVRGGIALSLARLNRIREIHQRDFVAVVQPGVITQKLQDAVEAQGPVLSARSRQPLRLHGGRQHRDQRRRAAVPEVRRHAGLRAGPRGGARRRNCRATGKPHTQEQDRLRSRPLLRRIRRSAGRGDRSDAQAAAAAALSGRARGGLQHDTRRHPGPPSRFSGRAFFPARSKWRTPLRSPRRRSAPEAGGWPVAKPI